MKIPKSLPYTSVGKGQSQLLVFARLKRKLSRVVGSIILRISHGYQVQGPHDPFVGLAENALLIWGKSTAPGAFLVDVFPFRRSH